jgi:hypothetical protein
MFYHREVPCGENRRAAQSFEAIKQHDVKNHTERSTLHQLVGGKQDYGQEDLLHKR